MLKLYRIAHVLPEEEVKMIVHRDPIIALKKVGLFFILVALPAVLVYMMISLFPSIMNHVWLWPTILLAISAYMLFIWLFLFFMIVDYILDVWFITDQRIIDVKQNGFFSRTVSEQYLSRVQDVSTDTHGVMETMFRYGDVTVQSAGQMNKLYFEQVPHPDHIRDLIIKLAHEAAKKSGQQTGPVTSSETV